MPAPDPRERGLDPAHILSVASQAIRGGHGHASRAVTSPGGIRVCLSSRFAAGDAATALTRVGYQVARIDGTAHRDLLVTGWNADRLEARLTAMRAVQHRLNENPASTADAVIERFRRLPPRSADHPETSVLADARAQLQSWVAACSGIHAPRNPAIVPADTGNALRLRLAQSLEAAIDNLVERHLRVASHALRMFVSLRPDATDEQAKQAAIRRASVIFHLNPSPAQDTPAPHQRPAQPPGPGSRSGRPAPDGRADGGAAQQAASGFPYPVRGAGTDARAVPAARPAGGHFPASRPGHRR